VSTVHPAEILLRLVNSINSAHYAPSITRKLNIALHIFVHQFIIVGIVMAAIGGTKLTNLSSSKADLTTAETLVKVGYILLLGVILELLMFAWFVRSRLRSSTEIGIQSGQANRLVSWTSLSTAFVAVRVIYGVVFAFDRSEKLSPYTGVFAVKFVLIFLVQLVATLLLLVGGLSTCQIQSERD
jgi:hypothetical protein